MKLVCLWRFRPSSCAFLVWAWRLTSLDLLQHLLWNSTFALWSATAFRVSLIGMLDIPDRILPLECWFQGHPAEVVKRRVSAHDHYKCSRWGGQEVVLLWLHSREVENIRSDRERSSLCRCTCIGYCWRMHNNLWGASRRSCWEIHQLLGGCSWM